ncbi:MAG: hypothetical protein P8N49_06160 [Opitutales bacterium]|nr:hypothetical protein [Opitutales bacterium]
MKFFLEDEGLIASTSELTLSRSSSSIQDWVSISQDSPEICVINRAFSEAHISDLPKLNPHFASNTSLPVQFLTLVKMI